MLVSSHGGAIVTERGRYTGVILYDDVTARIRDVNGREGEPS
jgi:osmoprotectant transport system ATP-binding protein